MAKWIDISLPVRNGMERWPEDPEVRVERLRKLETGDAYNLTTLGMSAHTGTHVDAPLHYVADGASIDLMPAEALIGTAVVIESTDFAAHGVGAGDRVLLKTGGELTNESAQWLAAKPVRAVGIDSLSIGGDDTHRTLLSAGVWIIEGLDLSTVAPGRYELICLPLRIEGADGAPARALLRRLI